MKIILGPRKKIMAIKFKLELFAEVCVSEFWARKDVKPSEMLLPTAP